MKKLIINADDFGLHPLINKGIIEGHQKGMITSTSIMPGAPYFEEAANLAAQNPELGIGIHLTLVGGVAPVLKKGVNSLLTLCLLRREFLQKIIQFLQKNGILVV